MSGIKQLVDNLKEELQESGWQTEGSENSADMNREFSEDFQQSIIEKLDALEDANPAERVEIMNAIEVLFEGTSHTPSNLIRNLSSWEDLADATGYSDQDMATKNVADYQSILDDPLVTASNETVESTKVEDLTADVKPIQPNGLTM